MKSDKRRFSSILIVILGVAEFYLPGQVKEGGAKRIFTHERDVETSSVWDSIPRWDGGRLIGHIQSHSSGPVIFTMDREGRRDETLFTLKDGALINILDVAGSANGEIAIAASAFSADKRAATFIARISADREHQTITRTWPYCPKILTFTPDGTVWTIGNLKDDEDTQDIANHVLRRFDPSGKMLGSATLRVQGWQTATTSFLRASRDRVGWFTRAGEYLEFSLDGQEIARYPGPEGAGVESRNITGMVLSEDNEVIVGHFGRATAEFMILDRERRSWKAVSVSKEQLPEWAFVLGLDGDTLVTFSTSGRLGRFKTR